MAKLVVLNKGSAGTAYELKAGKTTIGRQEDNAFPIPEPSVSGHHCEVHFSEDAVTVKDLDSTNGTFINGKQVKESRWQPGQTLKLGEVELRLDAEGAEGETTPESQQKRRPAGGLKANQLEFGHRPAGTSQNPMFAQKSDKANKVFITVSVVLGVIIVGLLLYAVFLWIQRS